MEHELIQLLFSSKKALSTGQSICEQANTFLQTSEHHVETIAKVHPKLIFVDNHIIIQSSILERIKEYINGQMESCSSRIKEHEARLQTLTIELTTIFDLLKKCTIDKDILQVNSERFGSDQSQNYTCLFDYISDQEIIELQRQADDEISYIESICNSLQNQSKLITQFLSDIAKLRKNALSIISLDDTTAGYTSERIQDQEDVISKMAEILISLTKHYDQLGEATRIVQNDPEGRQELDITVLEDDHEHIPNILEGLENSLEDVKSLSDDIQLHMQLYLNVRDEFIKILSQFEQFGSGGQLDGILEKITASEEEIQEREMNLEDFFKQLSALAEWYKCYASSYNFLLLEIERRKKAQEKQEALRRDLLKTFEDAYNDELQERKSWSAQHGQYLPEVLCPFINDSPAILKIKIESDSGRLPNLAPENVEKALAEIHNTHN